VKLPASLQQEKKLFVHSVASFGTPISELQTLFAVGAATILKTRSQHLKDRQGPPSRLG
jgi:hypothetical protein